ncbi:MAG: alpha/beta hydrolase [Alphaproteobacteria bacterium]|nr:alpha/beta hydrolase [Rhodobiaceae bacterium]MBO6541696.1 alpha/beta hydrolase [Alphaproteobacteria bacterium]MBO6628909.1 alpha/beta hydrolase [Alphaproteobacteria bacterium]MDF1625889.1 alpha/beta hydrolase [Parvibaculaceae bacterium]
MAVFENGGVEIAYDDVGEGKPILLLHGFASTRGDNWSRTGWYGTLQKTGRRVIAMDWRGHGESAKLYDPEDYGTDMMVGDAIRLLDHLEISSCAVMGFSMGAGLGLRLAVREGKRVSDLVLAGVGGKTLAREDSGPQLRADVFAAASADEISHPTARGFRLYAEQLNQDLKALGACVSHHRERPEPEDLMLIKANTLVVAGQRDDLAGDPAALASLIPGAKSELIPGADHMYLLTNGAFKGTVIDFLTGWL